MDLGPPDTVGVAEGEAIPGCAWSCMETSWGDEPWEETLDGMTCLCGSTVYYTDPAPFPCNIVDADGRWLR
ncbi:MAG: hypothetical protein ABW167_07630 [Baekduia sp.]